MRSPAKMLALLACLSCLMIPTADAQEYPTKPVRLIVGFAAGGGTDTIARLFADKLTTILGQSVVVLNQGGAAGGIAGKRVAAEEADGYTILVNSNSMVIYSLMNPRAGLVVERDLFAIASVAPQPIALVGSPTLNARSLTDLVDIAKARQLTYSTAGAGSVPHLIVEQLIAGQSGLKMQHIPFQGAAPALNAAVAGQVDFSSTTLPPAVGLVTADKLKGIAVTSPSRVAALPSVPTTKEAGFPALNASAWTAFFVPPKTPRTVIDKLEAAILRVAAMPDIKEKLSSLGYDTTAEPGDKFRRELGDEIKTWNGVLQSAKLVQE